MKTIDTTGYRIYSISDFVHQVYAPAPRKLILWDTCALLDIIRICFRHKLPDSFLALQKIHDAIVSGNVISVASELTFREWNDNIADVERTANMSYDNTTAYHHIGIDAVNFFTGNSYVSHPLNNCNLYDKLQDFAFDIIEKTHFIETKEIANDALKRVADHKAPGGKKSKSESKDCAVWLTMFVLCRQLNVHHNSVSTAIHERNFLTVNTDDFADKSGTVIKYQSVLLTEAAQEKFTCSFDYVDSVSKLHL